MKKIILLFIITLNNLLLCQYDISPYRQKNPSYYEIWKRKITEANIKNLSMYRLVYNENEILVDSILWQYYEYDNKGNDTYFEIFSESTGESLGYLRKKYDFLGNEISSVNYDYIDSNFIMTDSTTKIYDEQNRLHLLLRYNRDRVLGDVGFNVYHNNGNILYSEFAAIDRTHFENERYFYDENNKLIYTIRTNKNIASTKIRIDTIYSRKKKNDNLTVKYTKAGNILEWIDKTYYPDMLTYRFKFDSDENVLEKQYFEGNKLIYKIEYRYNKLKLLEKENQFDDKGRIKEKILYNYGLE